MSRGGGGQLQSGAEGGFLIQNTWWNRNQHETHSDQRMGTTRAPHRCSSQSRGEQGAAHFGLLFRRLSGRGVRLGTLCAQVEPEKENF